MGSMQSMPWGRQFMKKIKERTKAFISFPFFPCSLVTTTLALALACQHKSHFILKKPQRRNIKLYSDLTMRNLNPRKLQHQSIPITESQTFQEKSAPIQFPSTALEINVITQLQHSKHKMSPNPLRIEIKALSHLGHKHTAHSISASQCHEAFRHRIAKEARRN